MDNKISDHQKYNAPASACKPMDQVFEDKAQDSENNDYRHNDGGEINNGIEINVCEHYELLYYAVR
jgi:hypothetical protein